MDLIRHCGLFGQPKQFSFSIHPGMASAFEIYVINCAMICLWLLSHCYPKMVLVGLLQIQFSG